MTPAARVEGCLLPVAFAGIWVASRWFPAAPALGSVAASAAVTLLLQGFFRDLWLLYRQRTRPAREPAQAMKCMCLESTVGLTGVLVGVILTIAGVDLAVPLGRIGWTALLAGVMIFGFLTREHVITWSPWGIRRHPGHGSILVVWR